MKTKQIIGGILVIALAAAAYVWFFVYNKPKPNIEDMPAAFQVSASNWTQEFETSDSIAAKKYFDQVIEVKGTVSLVSSADSLTTVVLSASDKYDISCEFLSKYSQEAANIKTGTEVRIKGQFRGSSYDPIMADLGMKSDLKLMKCSLVNDK